jgi:hypothetical protein
MILKISVSWIPPWPAAGKDLSAYPSRSPASAIEAWMILGQMSWTPGPSLKASCWKPMAMLSSRLLLVPPGMSKRLIHVLPGPGRPGAQNGYESGSPKQASWGLTKNHSHLRMPSLHLLDCIIFLWSGAQRPPTALPAGWQAFGCSPSMKIVVWKISVAANRLCRK